MAHIFVCREINAKRDKAKFLNSRSTRKLFPELSVTSQGLYQRVEFAHVISHRNSSYVSIELL